MNKKIGFIGAGDLTSIPWLVMESCTQKSEDIKRTCDFVAGSFNVG
ncbi:hypothetical protein [Neobacillus sp. DY30]|nr:hypothetical protein [Neobacillus sp. DY30]WHY01927.1 hypothetical protein QNH29_06780 [Neobacillus sp. DY30]